jgi:SulP family sulfate permease
MVTGPANAISLTTMALIAPLAVAGSPQYVQLVLTLSFLVGAMQLLLGLARVGAIVERVPHSVVVGFTAGAALLIIINQLPVALGLNLPRGSSTWHQPWGVLTHLKELKLPALLAALVTVAVAVLARPLNRWVPAMLLAVLAGTLAVKLMAWLAPGWPVLATVQALPGPLPPLSWPDLSIDTVRMLFGATLVMTLLALTEATAIAKAVARQYDDTLDGNREFIGQGLANLAGSFFSSMPASGSFNRSGVNVEAGARTPLAAASAAVFLVLILSAVAPLAGHLPLAVVAGLLFVVAWGLIDVAEMRRMWLEEPLERVPLAVTLVGTVALSLEWAILLGITSALIVRRAAR